MPSDKPILIIAGPTAVGKTDASLLLAQELGAEIVSADSMQVYRGMDIGTAKPTPEMRALVYHHMIDIADPAQPYSVGDYLRDARNAIDGILQSGGTPIVVGGTGLYIRVLRGGSRNNTANNTRAANRNRNDPDNRNNNNGFRLASTFELFSGLSFRVHGRGGRALESPGPFPGPLGRTAQHPAPGK